MVYYFRKELDLTFDTALDSVVRELSKAGFSILTEIDMKDAVKRGLHFKFQKYRILVAHNPLITYLALRVDDKIGAMLLCNTIIQEVAGGKVEVIAVDPEASMLACDNQNLNELVSRLQISMKEVIAQL